MWQQTVMIPIGTHPNDPYATIEQALSWLLLETQVYIYPGTYTEDFPLTIPTGVSIRGDGLRAVKSTQVL